MEQTENNQAVATRYSPELMARLGMPSIEDINAIKALAKNLVDAAGASVFVPKALMPRAALPEGCTREMYNSLIVSNVFGAMIRGRELGFKPMESLRAFWATPDGSLGMYSASLFALMLRSGFKLEWKHTGRDYAELWGKRPGAEGLEGTGRWGTEDTELAGLNKAGSNYAKFGEDMNVARAIARLFRRIAPDLTGGPVYVPEEFPEVEMRESQGQWERNPEVVQTFAVGKVEPQATAAPEPAPPPAQPEGLQPPPAPPPPEASPTPEPVSRSGQEPEPPKVDMQAWQEMLSKLRWGPQTRFAAMAVADFMQLEPMEFAMWASALKLPNLPEPDALAVLQFAQHTREARQLLQVAQETGHSPATISGAVLMKMKRESYEDCEEKAMLEALAAVRKEWAKNPKQETAQESFLEPEGEWA